jgi:hypothetical protein
MTDLIPWKCLTWSPGLGGTKTALELPIPSHHDMNMRSSVFFCS